MSTEAQREAGRRRTERMRTDPVYRAHVIERRRQRYAQRVLTDQAFVDAQRVYRESSLEQRRQRLAERMTDPVYQERQRQKAKQYAEQHADRLARYHAEYRAANKERLVKEALIWGRANPERRRAIQRKWIENHKEQWRTQQNARRRKRKQERKATDERYAIELVLRSRLLTALRSRGVKKLWRTEQLIGCSITALRSHIEQGFVEGMSWSNRLEWHLDHIRPCASFDLRDPDQQRQCFHWSNLQPLWRRDNQLKGAKVA